MAHYAALLRGIGPSGKNMTNDKLRGVFEQLGFTKVGSVLSSGNIVFAADEAPIPELERRIESALNENLGIPGLTILRPQPVPRALLDTDPFQGLGHGKATYLTATFLKDGVVPEVEADHRDGLTRIVGFDPKARAVLAVTDNSHAGNTPDFMVWLEKTYGKGVTTRTWLTVQRIVKKLENL